MALQDSIETVAEWEEFFVKKLKLSTSTAQAYATSLFNEGYCEETVRRVLENTPPDQPSPTLSKLGIKAGHCLKMAVHMLPNQSFSSDHRSKIKIPWPTLTLDVNQVDFDQFCFEWRTYRTHYNIRSNEIASHLFYCGDEEVRKRIRLEKPSFTSSSEHTETELINILKGIVLSKVSKIVHIKQFYGLLQNTNESCNNYLIRLQTKASCCGFDCEPCAKERLKEQFIIGLAHKTIQTALLKTESIKPGTSLDVLLREALTLEQSLNDQISLKRQSEYLCAMETISQDTSGDEEHVKALGKASWNNKNDKAARLCSGCGSYGHSSFERQTLCPAWGKSCFNCGTRNHFSKCCRSKKASSNLQSGSAQLLEMTCMTVESSKSKLLRVMVQPKIPKKKSALYDILVFPDTGSSICLLGPKQLNALGLIRKDISPYISNVSVAGGSYIRTVGRFNVSIQIQGRTTEQVVYYSMKADRFILSRQACIALGVVPSTFPYPPPINTCGNCSNVAPSQTRETPIKHVGQSPSQLPVHRNLQDGLQMDPRTLRPSKLWLTSADKREEALRERNLAMAQRYNRTTRVLPEISIGTTVLTQDNDKKGNWCRSGVVMDCENRKYLIRMDGSGRIISRNRRFIKPVGFDAEADDSLLYPSTTGIPSESVAEESTPMRVSNEPSPRGAVAEESTPMRVTNEPSPRGAVGGEQPDVRIPRMLQRLMPYNKAGLNE